jgi:hypothetical protein
VNRITSIAAVVVLSVVINSNLFAQQTSSAVQIVTFGVSRTSQMLAHGFPALASTGTVFPISESKSVQQKLSSIPAKITFSSKVSGVSGSSQNQPSTSESSVSGAKLSSATLTPWNNASVQTDLRTFLTENESAPLGNSSLLLTITE